MERTFIFNPAEGNGGGNKFDITALLPGIMGNRGLDPNLLAVMGNRGAFGAAAGGYAGYGCGCGYNAGFWA